MHHGKDYGDISAISEIQMNKTSSFDYFEILSSILVTIAKGQHIVQCIREVLVQDPTFTPMNLFRYISKNQRYIRSKNIISFLDENNLLRDEKETQFYLQKIFRRYGAHRDNVQYRNFINFLYPWNSGILRDLTINKVKCYPNLDKMQKGLRPSDSIITGFLSLIQQEIQLQKKIQVQISDARFPEISKLRKIIKSIKQASHKICTSVIEKSNDHISMLELRNFVKAFIQVPEHLFIYLGKRLQMNKSGLVKIETIENLMKKSKKKYLNVEKEDVEKEDAQNNVNFFEDESFEQKKYQKEQNYRDQLYKQLADTLNISSNSRKTPRNKSKNNKAKKQFQFSKMQTRQRAKTPQKGQPRKQNKVYFDQTGHSFQKTPIQYLGKSKKIDNLRESGHNQNHEKKKKVKTLQENLNKIFKEYIQIFLRGYKQIDKCKKKLVSSKRIDFLSLFKSIDRGTGSINASDIRNLYVRLSGIPTDYDFELIINRFSQHDQQWLSYSQFTEIFKADGGLEQNDNIFEDASKSGLTYSIDLSPENMRVLSQILYLTLDLEYCLKGVLQRISKSQIQWIFNEICSSSQKAFINYQELKKYITEVLEITANMADTMSLLKRMDRSKNGVVVKQQFLTH